MHINHTLLEDPADTRPTSRPTASRSGSQDPSTQVMEPNRENAPTRLDSRWPRCWCGAGRSDLGIMRARELPLGTPVVGQSLGDRRHVPTAVWPFRAD